MVAVSFFYYLKLLTPKHRCKIFTNNLETFLALQWRLSFEDWVLVLSSDQYVGAHGPRWSLIHLHHIPFIYGSNFRICSLSDTAVNRDLLCAWGGQEFFVKMWFYLLVNFIIGSVLNSVVIKLNSVSWVEGCSFMRFLGVSWWTNGRAHRSSYDLRWGLMA